MASRIFRPSRILAVVILAGAAAWIYSGHLGSKAEPGPEPAKPAASAPAKPQKVSVATASPEQHARRIVLSCLTQADRRSYAVARAVGIITELRVKSGTPVKSGDVIAVLSDEGRDSAVRQAEALLAQRRAEFEARRKLIDRGDSPKNDLPALQAGVAAAEAGLASAQAEAGKSVIHAPVDGIVDSVPVEVGQAVQVGTQVAEVVGPDPMLAVGAVSERDRSRLVVGQPASVRFIDGAAREGAVSFVGLSGDKATRTYRVEARIANTDAAIADGVTCEMTVSLQPIEAAQVPRSALVFSDRGELGLRIADGDNRARFLPVTLVDDGRESVWVTGIDKPVRVIVVGQDFVADGEAVEAVSAADAARTEPPA